MYAIWNETTDDMLRYWDPTDLDNINTTEYWTPALEEGLIDARLYTFQTRDRAILVIRKLQTLADFEDHIFAIVEVTRINAYKVDWTTPEEIVARKPSGESTRTAAITPDG